MMTQDASAPPADPALAEAISTLLQQIKAEPVPEQITILAQRLQAKLDDSRAESPGTFR